MAALRDRLRAFWQVLTAAPPGGPTGGGRADGGGRAGGEGGAQGRAAGRRGVALDGPGSRAASAGPASRTRVTGPPRSGNGASSFHLIWEMPRTREAARLVEVSAVLEIVVAPRAPSLYFWALQVDFVEDGRVWGGGHTGLQWNRRFPRARAVNWGGYAAQERGGQVLAGSQPNLFAFPGDPNTMAFSWEPHRPYRLRVFRSPDVAGAWRADVTDLETGAVTVLRDLWPPTRPGRGGRGRGDRGRGERPSPGGPAGEAGYLHGPMVWSEVFADCDAPSVAARWSDLRGLDERGQTIGPVAVNVNYQSQQAGGCSNTTVRRERDGLLQVTSTPREIQQGSRLVL